VIGHSGPQRREEDGNRGWKNSTPSGVRGKQGLELSRVPLALLQIGGRGSNNQVEDK